MLRRVCYVLLAGSALASTAFGHCGEETCDPAPANQSGAEPRALASSGSFEFEPLPEKAAVLVVSPHPDDEGLFFGGSLPFYSQVRNLPTVLLSVTSGDAGIGAQPPSNRFLREDEQRDAAAAYGLKYEPIFARFGDGAAQRNTTPNSANVSTWRQFPNTGDDAADYLSPFLGNPVEYIARWIRTLRPEVLLASDEMGDYGHNDHRHSADATVAAYNLAADPNAVILDDEGNPLPAWAVTKYYVHDAQFNDQGDGSGHLNHLFHTRWEQEYEALGGLTPREVTDLGLLEHQSQGPPGVSRSYFGVTRWGSAYVPSELWTLLESTAGPDTPGSGVLDDDPVLSVHNDVAYGDFFEGVDLDPFASYLADFDGDGLISQAVDGLSGDFAVLDAAFGSSVPAGSVLDGDADGNGVVDQRDVNLFEIAYDDAYGSGAFARDFDAPMVDVDINRDGVVSGDGTGPWETDDVTAFIAGWGTTGHADDLERLMNGDINQDDRTSLADWQLLVAGLENGDSLNLLQLLPAVSAPEPHSVALLVGVGLTHLLVGSRRRGRGVSSV